MYLSKGCVLHADTKEEADKMAKKIFDNGEDNKDWYVDVGEIYDYAVEEIKNYEMFKSLEQKRLGNFYAWFQSRLWYKNL